MAVTLAPVLCSFFFVNKKEATDTLLDKLMKMRYLRHVELGPEAPRIDPRGDGFAVLLVALPDSPTGRHLHAPAGRRISLDPGHRAADGVARVRGLARAASCAR